MTPTKRKHPYDKYIKIPVRHGQQAELGDANGVHIEKRVERFYSAVKFLRFKINHYFYVELNVPFPQIYILGLQIIWEWQDHQLPLFQRGIEKIWHIGRVRD